MAASGLRPLVAADLDAAMSLLASDAVNNLFLLSRFAMHGLHPLRLGCEVLGLFDAGALVALVHNGSNVVPVGVDERTAPMFAKRMGARTRGTSIMGRAEAVRPLWEALCQVSPSWRTTREIRANQPMLLRHGPMQVEPDPRVQVIRHTDREAYFRAAVAMYTEEVGVSPIESSRSYQRYVNQLIELGRAFGIVDGPGGEVVFKADIGSTFGPMCQIQGVWLSPELRGQGLSAPAMAGASLLIGQKFREQTLYVNDFNTRARRLYDRLGFNQVSTYATVLY